MNPQADLPVNQSPASIPHCAVGHEINPSMYILDIEQIRAGSHESNVHSGEALTDNHLLTVPLIGGSLIYTVWSFGDFFNGFSIFVFFQTEAEEAVLNKKRSKKVVKKYKSRQKHAKVEQAIEEQFQTGRILACVASRPGQCGRVDGYVLEGKELEFYMRKIKAKKGK
ncbi:uncharacterized protein LOC108252555 [Diaphorina citri]|uniref:Uncharacterized protein LOC108252555 n=1 Tax=Diaphorina citri TaxID=121845 RepID=A0A3Q0J059_DIACI|nr:uncharacterized protein LOC108252555 [Diaphorina citri]